MSAAALPKSLTDNPRLDRWVAFEPDRTVRIATGKVELGQGVLTALAQIAAEELDVPIERLRLVSGDTAASPDEGTTAGSRSTEESGTAIRLVCAEVRAIFLRHIAATLSCDVKDLSISDGRVLRNGQDTGFDFWSLNEKIDLSRAASGTAPVKRPAEFRVIGRDVARVDLPAKIVGAAFVHDLALPDLLHARVVRQPVRGAGLISVDEAAVRRAGAGADVQVVRDGNFLAVVSPDETAAGAAAASAARHSVWQGGTAPAGDPGTADFLKNQPARDRMIDSGTPSGSAGARIVEATYTKPYIAHASLAPSCAVAQFKDGELTVWTHSQGVFALRVALARVLDLPAERIHVVHRQGAGCYGHNPADDVALDAALVARRFPGRPVRAQWSREDELSHGPLGSAMVVRMQAALDAGARPRQWTLEVWSGLHSQRPGSNGGVNLLGAFALPNPPPAPKELNDVPDAAGSGGTRNAVPLYDFPAQRIVHHLLSELPVRTSSMRGLGAFLNVFAAESFMDEIAEIADDDPVSYRLSLMSEPRARKVIETAAAMAGWSPRGQKGSGRAKGFGFARYKNKAGYCAVVVEAAVEETVRLERVWCAVDAGLVINPDGARNQIEGAIIQSASWTLKEGVRFADGKVVSTTWDDYPILKFSEVPPIEIDLIAAPEAPPLGIGEVATGPTAAAIGNAVAHALGTRIRDLPLTRERIMAALLAGA